MRIFVLMPFDAEFDAVYEHLIKQPLEEQGHVVNRADDVKTHQSIPKAIFHNIWDADIIVADLSAQNANVYYELGVAHSWHKPTIHIVDKIGDLAFDLGSHTAFAYSAHFVEAKKLPAKILDILQRHKQGNYDFSNPVGDSMGSRLLPDVSVNREVDKTRLESTAAGDGEGQDNNDDDASLGLLDSIVLAEASSEEIGTIIAELIDPMNDLSSRVGRHARRFQELNESPDQRGLNSQRLQIARKVAADLDEFTNEVLLRIPRLSQAWSSLRQGIGHVLSATVIESTEDYDKMVGLLEATVELRISLNESAQQFREMRDAQLSLPSISKATDRALSYSARILEKLLEEYLHGDSVLGRIIELATELIQRYQADYNHEDDKPES